MQIADTVCEACRLRATEIVDEHDDPTNPYRVCRPCHERLHAYALRPVEWYNLAVAHGTWQFLLHDDFYSEDGEAQQPRRDVEAPNDFPAPSLEQVRSFPDTLLEFMATRFCPNETEFQAWGQFDQETVLNTLTQRAGRDPNALSLLLDIAARVLRQYAADFVRAAWERPEDAGLLSLGTASAACLPREEGYSRVLSALASLEATARPANMFALAPFKSAQTLDWIEANVFEPTTESWGQLAALSSVSWVRILDWLQGGRPLSLVALDSLITLTDEDIPIIQSVRPVLLDPPHFDTLVHELQAYALRDRVPRVRKGVAYLLSKSSRLCRS